MDGTATRATRVDLHAPPGWLAPARRRWAGLAATGADPGERLLTVPVEGRWACGPVTCGQEHMLFVARLLSPWPALNIGAELALRVGLTEAEVATALAGLLTRHEALRTVYVPPPDGPAQQVIGDATLYVPVLETTAEGLGTAIGQAAEALADPVFDPAAELPLRAVLINVGGRPRHLELCVSHAMADADAVRLLLSDLDHLTADPAPVPVRAGARRPLDQAAEEHSAAGRRHTERALAHIERTLRQMPQTMLPRAPRDPAGPRIRYLEYCSPALGLASDAVVARHRSTPATVLYAGICAIAGHAAGLDRAYLQLLAGNRYDAATRSAVGAYVQDGLGCLDLADADFAELLTRAGGTVLSALRHSRYPLSRVEELSRRIGAERGLDLDRSCAVNDRRPLVRPVPAEPPTRAALDAARRAARWRWPSGSQRSVSTYFVNADHGPDGSVCLTMLFDASLIAPAEALSWLTGLERLLCAAALGDVAQADLTEITGVRPPLRDEHWVRVGPSWIDLRATRDLVREATGDPAAEVLTRPAGIVAELGGAPTDTRLAVLRARCLDALPGRRTAMVPALVRRGDPERPPRH